MFTPKQLLRSLYFSFALTLGSSSLAADLTIGQMTEPSSIDPLFSRTGNNQSVAESMFERLIKVDQNLQIQPSLAISWQAKTPTLWEIKLRSNVRFHNGSPFTAEDVVFSIERAKTVPNSPAPFTGAVKGIQAIKIVDPLTLEIRTDTPIANFIEQVGLVYIVSAQASTNKTTADFNSGKATIGTGPFKFVSWAPGDRLLLKRNDDYWGQASDFDQVTIRFMSNDAARLSALLSGSVDVIDGVPPSDVKTIQNNKKLSVYSTPSARIIYLALDSARPVSPFVTTLDGKPHTHNPLQQLKVRQALSYLVNRDALIQRLLQGSGVPANQLVPLGVGGFNPDIPPIKYDPKLAQQLLKDAGAYQDFMLTIHTSNDRFASDSDVAQAIGQMFTQGGVKVKSVVAQPYNVFSSATSKQEYSAFLFSFGTTTSSAAGALSNVLMTYDKDLNQGAFNRSRYSNPAFDQALSTALEEFDVNKRNQAVAHTAQMIADDVALIPLYFPVVHWATRADLQYEPNKNERTSPNYVSIKK